MTFRKNITVLVPSELIYTFDADLEPIFVMTRERGKIVVRPEVEYNTVKPCSNIVHDYKKGYLSGVTDGYEDGYRQGFSDGVQNEEFDPRYRAKHWLISDSNYIEPDCTGDCSNCRYYDELFDVCSYNI